MGTRAAERFIVTKKKTVKNDECRFRFSNYYIAKTIKKKVTACVFKT